MVAIVKKRKDVFAHPVSTVPIAKMTSARVCFTDSFPVFFIVSLQLLSVSTDMKWTALLYPTTFELMVKLAKDWTENIWYLQSCVAGLVWCLKGVFSGRCQNGGTCVLFGGSRDSLSVRCKCLPGFSGSHCEDDWCYRNGDHCMNGGNALI